MFVSVEKVFLTDGTGYPFPILTSLTPTPLAPTASTSSSFSDSTNSETATPLPVDPRKRHAGSTPYSFQIHSLHSIPKYQQRDRNRENIQLSLPEKIDSVAIRTLDGGEEKLEKRGGVGGVQRANYRNYDSVSSPAINDEETDGIVWSSLVVSKRASRRQWGKGNAFLEGMRIAKNAARERDSTELQHR